MNKKIMIRLLKGEHLSILDRNDLGIKNNEHIKFEDLVIILSEIINSDGWFPIKPKQKNKFVYEGAHTNKKINLFMKEHITRRFI